MEAAGQRSEAGGAPLQVAAKSWDWFKAWFERAESYLSQGPGELGGHNGKMPDDLRLTEESSADMLIGLSALGRT